MMKIPETPSTANCFRVFLHVRPISSLPTEIQQGSKLWLSLGQSLNLFSLEPSLGGFDGTPKIIALMKGPLQLPWSERWPFARTKCQIWTKGEKNPIVYNYDHSWRNISWYIKPVRTQNFYCTPVHCVYHCVLWSKSFLFLTGFNW